MCQPLAGQPSKQRLPLRRESYTEFDCGGQIYRLTDNDGVVFPR
jgi:hypothetical protein